MHLLTESMLQSCGVRSTDTVLAGLSGGADSVALVHGLCALRDTGRVFQVCAAHFNHGIRGAAADRDEAFCRAYCERLGVQLTVERADVPAYARAHNESLEQAARTLRYDFFHRTAETVGAGCIMTAHHRDDQAETLLLHLLRGCGVGGLAAMRPRSGDIARPLLDTSRAQIEAYVQEHSLAYCVDETNTSPDMTRNRIRAELMPLLRTFNPKAAEALAKTAELAAQDDAFLESLADAALQEAAQGGGYDRRSLLRQPAPVLSRAMRALLLRSGGEAVAQADIRRATALLGAQAGTRIELSGGRSAWVDSTRVHIGAYPAMRTYETPFEANGETPLPGGGRILAETVGAYAKPADGREAYLDFDALPRTLCVRTRRAGDRFFPLGAPGERKLSDCLSDRKIPLPERDMPLLACGGEIFWVCGYTVGQKAAVTADTKRILHIIYEEETEP